MKTAALLLFVMLCMMPVMAMAHKGVELHCNVNDYQLPCYEDKTGQILYKQEPEIVIELEEVTEKVETENRIIGKKRDHYIEWFDEGVLVCGTLDTKNPIAKELLLEPYPEWRFGISDKWLSLKKVQVALRELGIEYYCRYTLYR